MKYDKSKKNLLVKAHSYKVIELKKLMFLIEEVKDFIFHPLSQHLLYLRFMMQELAEAITKIVGNGSLFGINVVVFERHKSFYKYINLFRYNQAKAGIFKGYWHRKYKNVFLEDKNFLLLLENIYDYAGKDEFNFVRMCFYMNGLDLLRDIMYTFIVTYKFIDQEIKKDDKFSDEFIDKEIKRDDKFSDEFIDKEIKRDAKLGEAFIIFQGGFLLLISSLFFLKGKEIKKDYYLV